MVTDLIVSVYPVINFGQLLPTQMNNMYKQTTQVIDYRLGIMFKFVLHVLS